MAAPTGYPSWVYNSTQLSSLIVQNVAAFNALGGAGTWTTTPFSTTVNPFDPNEQITDQYLKNLLVEMRVQTQILSQGFLTPEDPVLVIRPDIVANDVALASL